jgi:hypothetical protein
VVLPRAFVTTVVGYGPRLCENARDWRPDYVRGYTGEDLAERRGEIRDSSPASI